jgi:hypothetical protein
MIVKLLWYRPQVCFTIIALGVRVVILEHVVVRSGALQDIEVAGTGGVPGGILEQVLWPM